MKTLNAIILTAFLFFALNTSAQDRIVHGWVFTFDSIPLVGAEVAVKSTKQVVRTDSVGNFSVGCNNEDQLKVSAKGFTSAKFKVDEKIKVAIINMKLKLGEKNREIAIGYGYVLDADKLNAVASLNNKDLDFSQYSNMYELIQGRFAGVQISNGDIIIRGVNSINSGSGALIVLDGTPVDNSILRTLPPTQVKSINVIKDGSAAIYGSRGANGVVVIESKKGND
ncbi:MAG TPA: TonB-dependent receptor [Prolixibacteraceae bacterium]|nr:TonB-dependent receptor [Prolixibacteraceae bacterium]